MPLPSSILLAFDFVSDTFDSSPFSSGFVLVRRLDMKNRVSIWKLLHFKADHCFVVDIVQKTLIPRMVIKDKL